MKSMTMQARSWAYAGTPVRIIIFKSRKTENSKSALKIEGRVRAQLILTTKNFHW